MTVTGKARVAGVIGWPVGHSLSPVLHGHWLAEYGVDGAYVPLAVRPEHGAAAMQALPALGFAGANVTVPHKETALSVCERLSDAAKRIGAVNTLVVAEDGTLEGDNTDAFGFLANLEENAPGGFDAAEGPVVVLGAGGAARAVLAALIDAGAPEVRLLNRTASRAETLADEFGRRVFVEPWERRGAVLADTALLVNTTSLGMTGHAPLEIALAALPVASLVTDLVYAPLRTPLLEAAAARGNPTVDGLGMLLHQARPGFERWFGRRPEVTPELRAAVLAARGDG